MTDERENPVWRPASHGAGKRHWGVARFAGREWLENNLGRIRWFSSQSRALAAAIKANDL